MVNKQECKQKSAANVNDFEEEPLKQSPRIEKDNINVVGGNIANNSASGAIINKIQQQQLDPHHTAVSSPLPSPSANASSPQLSAKSTPPINYARNAAANNHKLIPIQSVLTTAADAHNHHTHASHHHHQHFASHTHHPHHHSLVVGKTSTKSLPLQNGTQQQPQHQNVTHLHVPTSKAQQLLVSATTHAQLPTEMPHEDEERLEKLFKQLDRDGNGRIDIHDLSEALREFGLSSVYAEKFLEHSDKTQSGDVGLAEFVHYIREHEKNLRLQFSHLDKNRDGKVDLEELISAFEDLGLEVDVEEAKHLLSRMDQDGSLNISFNEWRDFLLLAPSTDIHDLIKFWRHSTHEIQQSIDDPEICTFLWLRRQGFVSLNEINGGRHNKYLDIGEDMNVPDDFTQIELQSGMWWRHLAAGGIAGAVSRTCTAPLDRIKVYLQVQTHKTGISDSLRYMLQEGGLRSMWRGNGINVLKIAPESAIKFAAYEKIKRLIRGNEKRQMSIGERFLAGAAAGGISQTAIYPMEVLKTRLALRKTGQYTGIVDAAKKIYTTEGVRSFYRGYIPNILGIVPYAGIDLAVYETLKKKYLSYHNTEQPSFLVLLACGSTSSTLGQVCSYPLALVRTRLQAQVVTKSKHTSPMGGIPLKQAGVNHDDNMLGVFRKILQTEGICGLYRGITPNFIKVLPAVSISYVVYEYVSRGLGVNMT